MSRRLVVRRAAREDVRADRADHERIRPGLGAAFAQEVQQTFDRIRYMPEAYGFVAPDVRAAGVRRFNYVVYYRLTATQIRILAVIHGARDASVWRSRI